MAASKSSSPRLTVLVLSLIGIVAYLLIAKEGVIQNQISLDRSSNRSAVGPEMASRAEQRAIDSFNRFFVATGLVARSYDSSGPGQGEVGANATIASAVSHTGAWWGERVDVWWSIALMALVRLEMMLLWLPYCLILLVAVLVDALVVRRIKSVSFSMTSPHVFRIARASMWVIPLLLLLSLFAPFHVPSLTTPILAAAFSISLWVAIGQFAKRA